MKSLNNKITKRMTAMKAYHSSDIAYKEAYLTLNNLEQKLGDFLPMSVDSMIRHRLKVQIRKEYSLPHNPNPISFRSFVARD
jgi:hypothetical protein